MRWAETSTERARPSVFFITVIGTIFYSLLERQHQLATSFFYQKVRPGVITFSKTKSILFGT